ncbi:MAG TPA: hypothetical protein VN632_11315 [Stellaceae bacterium]|nr:hypothetical protein [Stellaceae bacterium]
MWKEWLERTLTDNKVPVMMASEIMCVEPANGNDSAPARPAADATARLHPANKTPEPAEAQ